jgi:glycosyltransferase involved in cell wall biosynthesis
MRVAVVSDQYPPMAGGVPAAARALARGLAERGHRVWVVAPSARDPDERPDADEIPVCRFASFAWAPYPGQRIAVAPVRALCGLLRRLDPEVVHIHTPLTLGLATQRAARRLRLPVVATHHYLPAHVSPALACNPWFGGVLYAYLVWFYDRCTLVTAPSADALLPLRAHGLTVPATVVSNGVDLRAHAPGRPDHTILRRLGLPEGRPLVLHVNRLAAEKRIDVLLDALARTHGDAHLVLAGAGPAEAGLRARARRLGLHDRVSFLGHVVGHDLLALRRAAAVCAIASDSETQSLATMEAMACGLPVVAADAGALPELVRHGENGLLFAPGDHAALAAHLDRLLDDRALRVRMGARGLVTIARHDRHGVLERWEALYERASVEMARERVRHVDACGAVAMAALGAHRA